MSFQHLVLYSTLAFLPMLSHSLGEPCIVVERHGSISPSLTPQTACRFIFGFSVSSQGRRRSWYSRLEATLLGCGTGSGLSSRMGVTFVVMRLFGVVGVGSDSGCRSCFRLHMKGWTTLYLLLSTGPVVRRTYAALLLPEYKIPSFDIANASAKRHR
jgi:hypothetical protein